MVLKQGLGFLAAVNWPIWGKDFSSNSFLVKKKRLYLSWNEKPCCQISTLKRLNEQKLWVKKLPQGIYHTILDSFWCLKNTYPICDSPLWRSARRSAPLQLKSRRNHHSCVWTETLSYMSMVFVPTRELSIRYSLNIAKVVCLSRDSFSTIIVSSCLG